MKKLIAIIGLVLVATGAGATVNFQKVYDMEGSASSIITNFSKAVLIDKNLQGDSLTGKAVVRCLVSEEKLGGLLPAVYSKYRGDLLIEAKDGRYRVTFSNMLYESELDGTRFMHGMSMNEKLAQDCVADFEKFLLSLQNRAKSFDNKW